MIDFRADLHCHTCCSDGELTPEELVHLAKKQGLQGLSITDHDTVSAFAAAKPVAQELGIDLLPGVEFSTIHQGASVHILAYSFDEEHPAIATLCKQHEKRRESRFKKILHLLESKGMPLTPEEVIVFNEFERRKNIMIGRPHIAVGLVKKGYVKSYQEAFSKYIGEGKPCYFPGEGFSVAETIAIIHEAGGLAVIAHPHLVSSHLIPSLLKESFDGIEGHYSLFSQEQCKKWIDIGKQRQWIVTGGSDFHGKIKPKISLGCSYVEAETFQILKDHYQKK